MDINILVYATLSAPLAKNTERAIPSYTTGRRSPSAYRGLQDGFELAGVRFVKPFEAANNRLIDEVLPPR